jgi:hypothetical protein
VVGSNAYLAVKGIFGLISGENKRGLIVDSNFWVKDEAGSCSSLIVKEGRTKEESAHSI